MALSVENLQTYALFAVAGLIAMAIALFFRRRRAAGRGNGALLSMVLNNMTQGVVLFDAHERVLVCNDRYVEMYGLSAGIVKPGCTLMELIKNRIATGSLNIDALGVLRAGNGMPVIGNGGPIAIPPEQKVEVGEDGTISIRAMGEDPRVMAEVDRIKLVNPDTKGLTKEQDGLIHTSSGQPADADVNVRVVSGFLQGSNVNAVEEMTSVLALSRQFELHVKMMNAAKEGDEAMARVLQLG